MIGRQAFGFLLPLLALAVPHPSGAAESERQQLVNAALKIAPSVVRIDRVAAQGAGGDMVEGAPTSGLIIDNSGLVLTSRLSVSGNPSGLLVSTADGQRYGAKLIAEDISREIALLQIDSPKELSAATLSTAPSLPLGLGVIAVGCAIDSETPTLSLGIISGSQRSWGRAIQTDARVSLSQLGGPLLDREGQVLGILIPATGTEMAGEEGLDWYDSGVALATPSVAIASRLARLRKGENLHEGRMGISLSEVFTPGTEITSVHPGSPAAKAGIRPGDHIVAIGDVQVQRMDQVRVALGAYDAGDPLSLTIRNEKGERQVELDLVETLPPYEPGIAGFWCQEKAGAVFVTQIMPGSPAAKAKIAIDDQVISAGGEPVSDPQELATRVNMLGKGDSLDVALRDAKKLTLQPVPISGTLPDSLPTFPPHEGEWKWQDLALPEMPNKARLWGPAPSTESPSLGLIVLAAAPSRDKLDALANQWQAEAQQAGTLIVVVGAREKDHWNADEAELLARVARQAMRRWNIDRLRVAVSGEGPGGALAIVAGLAEAETFRGFAVPKDTKFPRIRPTANDPAESVQILWMGGEELPKWVTGLKALGYASRYCEETPLESPDGGKKLLIWNRLLGLI